MLEIVALAAAFAATWLLGVTQGKQWGREGIGDPEMDAWRQSLVGRVRGGSDDCRTWGRELGSNALHLVSSNPE